MVLGVTLAAVGIVGCVTLIGFIKTKQAADLSCKTI